MSQARALEQKPRGCLGLRTAFAFVLRLALACAASCALAVRADAAPLSFRLDEGRNLNAFTRDGQVAAHLLLRSGEEPRILVAFPAGDSGVAVWFAKTD
ncbi:MAG TPA: hypothetical protein VFO94_14250, partial [Gammaproteobacteria bacterium]|nr:hypothetical protein [Gammaproteobacteria bacterium]